MQRAHRLRGGMIVLTHSRVDMAAQRPALSGRGILSGFLWESGGLPSTLPQKAEACPLDRAAGFYEPLIRLARRLTPRRSVYLLCPSQAPSTSLLSTVSTATWSTTCTRTERTFSTPKLKRTTKKSWTFLESTLRTRAAGGTRHPQNASGSRFRHP